MADMVEEVKFGGEILEREEGEEQKEIFSHSSNDQPLKVSIRVDKTMYIQEIINLICDIEDVNLNVVEGKTTLTLYFEEDGIIQGVFDPEFRMSQYNFTGNELLAVELLTTAGRDQIKNYYQDNPSYILGNPDTLLNCLMDERHTKTKTQIKEEEDAQKGKRRNKYAVNNSWQR